MMSESLLECFPEIAEEWDYNKNGLLKPESVSRASNRVVWWICSHGHNYKSKISNRTILKRGCPFCSGRYAIIGINDLATTNPELANEWHPVKNEDKLPEHFKKGSTHKVWWLGKCGHEWEASIYSRAIGGNGCPYCSSNLVLKGFNDLMSQNPSLAEEWDYEKNITSPDKVMGASNKKYFWKCKLGHSWEATANNRLHNQGCPYCSNQRLLIGFNDLKTKYPQVAAEWDYKKNGSLLPQNITYGTNKIVWWVDELNHSWRASVNSRTKMKVGCPYCANVKLLTGFNDLETKRPDLAKEWNYSLNDNLPSEYIVGSKKQVFWKCVYGHVWKASIDNRCLGTGCPICSGKRKTSFPEQAFLYYIKKQISDVKSRYIIQGHEFDIYIPHLSIAIEYDGYAWHKDKLRSDNIKDQIARDNSICLFRIREEGLEITESAISIFIPQSNRTKQYYTALNNVIIELLDRMNLRTEDIDVERDQQDIKEMYYYSVPNSLWETDEQLVKDYWDFDKNSLTPFSVSRGSHEKVYWKCSVCGSSFISSVHNRVRTKGMCKTCVYNKRML